MSQNLCDGLQFLRCYWTVSANIVMHLMTDIAFINAFSVLNRPIWLKGQ
jgi:hypothetical protein